MVNFNINPSNINKTTEALINGIKGAVERNTKVIDTLNTNQEERVDYAWSLGIDKHQTKAIFKYKIMSRLKLTNTHNCANQASKTPKIRTFPKSNNCGR